MTTEKVYNPAEVEHEAQEYWDSARTFEVKLDHQKDKFYCLSMFPYPSGKLHMGHVRNYTISDVIARYQRMLGKNVLHPMGWDAFGLPAENAAIQNNTAPAKWTSENIDYMRSQLKSLGFGFDWSRELTTCDPEYYKWEQWFFTRLYDKGLVYKKTSAVNWCPKCSTVLANEQVIDGRCWRCESVVENKNIPQWFIRITEYAEQLLSDLSELDQWPEQVKTMQRNWIGKSRGVTAQFQLSKEIAGFEFIEVYTTRPDTIMGVTYISLAPEHPIAVELSQSNSTVYQFVQKCRELENSEFDTNKIDKQGFDTGIYVHHPLSNKKIPLWIANYVLMSYGSGAIMAVPAHDQRDYEFAEKYRLPKLQVVETSSLEEQAITDKGVLINSGKYDGLEFEAAFNSIASDLEKLGLGRVKTNYRLRDWGVSRQRYWGAPIPIYNLPDGGEIPVPSEKLPVLLPEDIELGGSLQSPLKSDKSWKNSHLNGQRVERETDTFDTFMESSWYYARFTCPRFNSAMLDTESTDYWLPVDQYIGGIEHAIMHLLYARFFHKLLRDEGLVKSTEPFKRLLCQGMVLAESFYKISGGRKNWLSPDEVTITRDSRGRAIGAVETATKEPVNLAGMAKMSKSKNNGVDPQATIERYGADTVRLFTMFAAPPEQTLEWNDEGVAGASRFLKKLWRVVNEHIRLDQNIPLNPDKLSKRHKELRRKTHLTINKVDDDYNRRNTFNTAIAAVMELLNEISRHTENDNQSLAVRREALTISVLLLSPIAPHITHSLWQLLGHHGAVANATWPSADASVLERDSMQLVVQVNGKVRGKIELSVDADKSQIEKLALQDENARRFFEGLDIKKLIVVPGKLVNIVAS